MLGIIGGTGLYSLEELEIVETREVTTPFGEPSAPLVCGKYGSNEVVFVPRHGRHHERLPHEVNYRANIYALKMLGVTAVIGVSAVGSLREEIKPGDLSIPDQYFDFVKGAREKSFFGEGLAAHVSTAEPTCAVLTKAIADAAAKVGVDVHTGKTYGCVDGPRLGTRAESFFLRDAARCDLVGMTNVPEVFLAREAQMSYCTIGIATDYDCWRDDPSQFVSVAQVMECYGASLVKVKQVLESLLSADLPDMEDAPARRSLDGAVMTSEGALSEDKKELLAVLKT